MTLLTMDVILATMFSLGTVPEAAAAADAVKAISDYGMREMYIPFDPPAWMLPWRREKERALKLLDDLVWRFVRERRAAPGEQPDVLGMLLSVRDDEGDQRGLSDEEVRDQCATIFLAGHETTATALTWWGWAMAAHPEVAQRAAREVDEVLGGREPTYADVAKLAYLGQTLKETMRLRPPAAGLITREASEDVEIGGWRVPRGAMLRITPYAVHHDPRWFPDPERFDPDRFAPGRVEQMPRGAYVPFGIGPRVCIGSMFATIEMTLIAAMLLQRFRFAMPPGAPAPTPRLKVTLRPADGLRLLLQPR
jgi:cytochrome P450